MVGVFPALYLFLLFNKRDERVSGVAVVTCSTGKEVISAFHVFSLATVLYYLTDKILSVKKEASLILSFSSLLCQ